MAQLKDLLQHLEYKFKGQSYGLRLRKNKKTFLVTQLPPFRNSNPKARMDLHDGNPPKLTTLSNDEVNDDGWELVDLNE